MFSFPTRDRQTVRSVAVFLTSDPYEPILNGSSDGRPSPRSQSANMANSSDKTHKITDYNQIFVKLDETGPSIVSLISSVANQAATISRYTDAADSLNRAAPTGFVSSLA